MSRIWAFPIVYTDESYDSMNKIYVKPWYRFCSYGVGLLLGSILFSMKGKCLGRGMLTKVLMMVGWVVSLTTIFLIIYAIDPGHSLTTIYFIKLLPIPNAMIRILCRLQYRKQLWETTYFKQICSTTGYFCTI